MLFLAADQRLYCSSISRLSTLDPNDLANERCYLSCFTASLLQSACTCLLVPQIWQRLATALAFINNKNGSGSLPVYTQVAAPGRYPPIATHTSPVCHAPWWATDHQFRHALKQLQSQSRRPKPRVAASVVLQAVRIRVPKPHAVLGGKVVGAHGSSAAVGVQLRPDVLLLNLLRTTADS